jgi:hypothetical protein
MRTMVTVVLPVTSPRALIATPTEKTGYVVAPSAPRSSIEPLVLDVPPRPGGAVGNRAYDVVG